MHKDHCDILARVSDSFKHPIFVLDLGCGTGRYFHCLQHTERIIGIDASLDMLAQARHPVRASKITASVDLICANIIEVTLRPQSFDLIYCLGVLGVWCPLEQFFLEKVETMLKADGKFIFTVVDARSPSATSWKRVIAQTVRPFLPLPLRRKVDVRLKSFRVTEQELRSIMDQSQFSRDEISLRHSGTGRIDFLCIASLAATVSRISSTNG